MSKKERFNTHQPFAVILNQLRVAARYTKTQLAALVGVSKNHIGELESGHSNPSYELYVKILSIFGYEPSIRKIPRLPKFPKTESAEPEEELSVIGEAQVESPAIGSGGVTATE